MGKNSLSGWLKGIKGRLLIAAILPFMGFGAIYVVASQGLYKLHVIMNDAHTLIIPNLEYLAEMRQSRNKFGYQIFAALDSASDPIELQRRVKRAREGIEEFSSNYKAYAAARFADGEAVIHDKAKDHVQPFISIMDKIADLIETGEPEKLAQAKAMMLKDFTEANNIIRDFNRDVSKLYSATANADAQKAIEAETYVKNMLLAITLLAGFSIFAILMWIAARVSTSVSSIAGNLSETGTQVASAIEQLEEAGNSLSQSSTEAAASLEETVAALEEMSSMVQMNSDNAKQAAALSVTSRQEAETGEQEIQNLIQSMTGISQASKKIEEIISVIDDIAFQTNLLALNAAVEAARAGEQGKGFAVVAEAVRTLAQRSAASAKDISNLIKDSVSQIDRGSRIADQSGEVLTKIVNSIKKVADLNNEIAAASSEQTTGIQQISKAMNQLDQAAQSNAASAEEIAATSGEINNLAARNQDLTVELNSVILGSDHSPLPKKEVSAHAKAPPKAKKKASPAPGNKEHKVLEFKTKPKEKQSTEEILPFDEDDERAKVGTTDGF